MDNKVNRTIAGKAIKQVVHNQIKNNEPPETKQTYKRLIAEGYPKDEAIRLIACCLSTEMFDMLKNQEEYDNERYIGYLKNLPDLPFGELAVSGQQPYKIDPLR